MSSSKMQYIVIMILVAITKILIASLFIRVGWNNSVAVMFSSVPEISFFQSVYVTFLFIAFFAMKL